MPKIRRLSQSLVNKIAAGEVIERPASVVKELVENAVDAGATRIDVSIASGGVEMIRVVDNGCGIPPDELELAVASHATSKITSAEDLFSVGTLGFRGEALASIAEVSRLVLRSRTAESHGGAEIEVVGGNASGVAPCGCPVGTTIEVRSLFFNTPVRRKFLRSPQTELGHASEAFSRIALAAPSIHFTLRHNDREIFDMPGSAGWLERIAAVAGRQLAESLIWVESEDGPVRVSGYVAHPSESRSNNRMQYLFLNGRYIRDRSLGHALGEAYRGLLMTGRFPIAFLALELPPETVDVNVHPTKLEVRFQESGRLYSQLLSTLRTKFLATDLTARAQRSHEEDPTEAIDEQSAIEVRQQVVDWAKGEIQSWSSRPAEAADGGGFSGGPGDFPGRAGPLELAPLERRWAPAAGGESEEEGPEAAGSPRFSGSFPPEGGTTNRPPAGTSKALQLHNRYLVAESDEGMIVIDQHALHERILYEHLKERISAGGVVSQSLLMPEPVDLSPVEAAAALEQAETLARLGMKIEAFGRDTVLITGYPAMLANVNPGEVLRGLVEQLVAGGKLPDQRDLLDELLHMIACKAAIKAGDRLAPEEIDALLGQRHLIDDAHHCPHGRPTAVIFSREELDKHFKRI
jgi:DNA mismatch repair protein MutL